MPIAAEDRDRYPADWASRIRPAILLRSQGRCECAGECGAHAGRRCPEVHLHRSLLGQRPHQIHLAVVHLNHTPEDDDPAILRAFCQGCHLRYDRKHHGQSAVRRQQRGLERSGQVVLFEAPAGNAPCPPNDDGPSSDPPVIEASPGVPDGRWEIDADALVDALQAPSLQALPDEVRAALEAEVRMHLELEALKPLVSRGLAAVFVEARSHGALATELFTAARMTKPRYHRLLKQAGHNEIEASDAATSQASDTQEDPCMPEHDHTQLADRVAAPAS